jgi:hypothetical protein
MPLTEKAATPQDTSRRTSTDATVIRSRLPLILVAAWALPGAGHLWLGRWQKGLIFFAALLSMFLFGLWLEGQLFPFDLTQPLVALMAFADIGMGIPYLVARATGVAGGRVVAITYEYGNTFMIVAGLLNMLIVLDALDVAEGRK